jgi:hypothetical protein
MTSDKILMRDACIGFPGPDSSLLVDRFHWINCRRCGGATSVQALIAYTAVATVHLTEGRKWAYEGTDECK